MDPLEISRLAKHLRQSGDKVLNSNFALTLSGGLLRALNDSFSLIADENEICAPQTFQVVKPNNSKSDAFRDLQFIYDFVQKTTILRLTNFQNDDFDGVVDVSKFRSLKVLQIQRIGIQRIVGIQRMRPYLVEISCNRSIESVQDIISHCGGDNCTGFTWDSLHSADFSYNLLTTIDCSLEFAPALQHLNLSHNKIVSVDAMKWLPNLKIVNLGFNRLKYIPTFHNEAARRLQTLILTSNFIEDIQGISSLDSLSELDVSGNCILDHSSLLPLSSLINLSYLNLHGNPLSFHPSHRQITAKCLHKNTSSVKFVLDMQPLSKAEKALAGTKTLSAKFLPGLFRSSGRSTPTRSADQRTPSSSVGSSRSNRLDEITDGNEMIVSRSSQKKNVKKRPAEIADINDDSAKEKTAAKSINFEGNKDHLETKRQIESLRKQYGDGWLHSQGASMVHEVLGIKSDNIERSYSSEQMLQSLLEESGAVPPKSDDCLTSTPNISTVATSSADLDVSIDNPTDDASAYISSNNTCENVTVTEEQSDAYQTATDLSDIYAQSCQSENVISDTEDNEVHYIVCVEPTDIEMILVVSDISMKEKNVTNGRTKNRWNLTSLESCDRIKSDVLRLNFDTIKKDRKERIYRVEEGLCQQLEQYLRGILAKRPLSEMNQSLYRCANCTTQFSRENFYKQQNIEITCPECKSSYVIEIKESPRAQSIERVGQYLQQNSRFMEHEKRNDNSGTQSSIGSATSLNESSSCSKISKSQSSFDSNQSVAGSSNCDRDADFQFNKNGDSDIEILSNPSQSSIGIIDSIQSSRKHSEERRLSQTEGLDVTASEYINNLQLLTGAAQAILVNQQTSTQDLTIDTDNSADDSAEREKKTVLSGLHLTESSSSGSVTDGSICTAYEQGHGDASNSEISSNKTTSPVNEKLTRNDNSITSMFGGLFQSTNLLMSKTVKDSGPAAACDKFKFSYTDFSNVDHRFKLFLYQHIFEDEGEHLKWLVKGKIFNDNNNPTSDSSAIIRGIFVMSTTKFYVLQIMGNESEDIFKWTKRRISGTVDRIETVRVLPWKIGVTLTIKGIGTIHLLLQDIARTDSLLLFFANNPLPMYCTLEYQISERLSQKLLKTTNNAQLKMLAILENCETSLDDASTSHGLVGLIITESELFLICPTHQWLSDRCDVDIVTVKKQFMNNLVEVEKHVPATLKINFLDENTDKCELWTCGFIEDTCLESTMNAISISWEKLFGVPLLASN
ncbi:serine/threonine-protein kinase 11-interacting protein isoform X2 [Bradysia coprophila]|uniref:serine/threonine-protein kinase 11-interacting protein isoform X2 n=1 Tax=Bradysia coprophila TaxID=38358 RepID=UPI00187D9A7E|nr:serine/threonine-protein kinase 11-interacting protein isoform X2 [Bradysia coprophila]